MMRPMNSAMIGLAVIVGEVVAAGGIPPLETGIWGFLTGFFVSSSSMVLNDYFDAEVDRVNNPGRPIPSGRVSKTEAFGVGLSWGGLGVLASLYLSLWNTVIAVAFWFVGFFYDWVGKKRGLFGNLLVSLSVGIPFVFGAAAVGRVFDTTTWFFFAMAVSANMAREVAKGVPDVEGDLVRGVETFAMSRGKESAGRLASSLLLFSVAVSPLPFLMNLTSTSYLFVVSLADAVLLWVAVTLWRKHSDSAVLNAKKGILLGMLLGLLAFLSTSLI